jgi:hypothetical protein
MEPTKKRKVKCYLTDKLEADKIVNEFLFKNESINVKSIAMDEN